MSGVTSESSENRPSALKASLRDPLGGSPVMAAPAKKQASASHNVQVANQGMQVLLRHVNYLREIANQGVVV